MLLRIHELFVWLKEYTKDFVLVFVLGEVTNFWAALKTEINWMWVAHLIGLLMSALFVKVIAKILARWISEHIEEMSDLDFMHEFKATWETFEKLKSIDVHGKMYRPNYSYIIYDRNKLKVLSKFMWIKTSETFEVVIDTNTVALKNISGKYDSELVYEFNGTHIIAHWMAKPKGLRRAITLLFKSQAMKLTIEDFQNFVDAKQK